MPTPQKIILSVLCLLSVYGTNIYGAHAETENKKKLCLCEKFSKLSAVMASISIPKELQHQHEQVQHRQSLKDCHPKPFNKTSFSGMVWVPPGEFMMGGHDEEAKPDELPLHKVVLKGFYMDATEVTNQQFEAFATETHYVTTSEKPVNWELLKRQLPLGTPKPPADKLMPGALVFSPPDHPVNLNDPSQWWKWVHGANWHHPLGPHSKIFGADHPVVQVSWDDAHAYCQWAGKRLPTEAEREWAARGGLHHKTYPWGNEDIDAGQAKANTWQGHFPNQNTMRDHYYWTSPVTAFRPNNYGLYDMAGNVWEWTSDLYDANYYATLKKQGTAINPKNTQTYFDPDDPGVKKYILRGGSFLCNKIYCSGYRVSARMKSTPDTALVNVGFRCVKDN